MKLILVSSFVTLIMVIITMAMLMPVAGADIIPIATINDSYINNKVTVSGVVASISYESPHKCILTIDDRSGTILVSSDTRLFGRSYGGERITVTGVYVGKNMVYADLIYSYVGQGYKDVTVAELKEFLEYYYDDSVRIKGNITRIELTSGRTELGIDDNTGTMNVEYGVEMGDIKIGDGVIVEGKFYRNKIYAFEVKKIVAEGVSVDINQTNQSVVEAVTTPAPTETPSPPTAEPIPSAEESEAKEGFGFLPVFGIASAIIIAAVVIIIKVVPKHRKKSEGLKMKISPDIEEIMRKRGDSGSKIDKLLALELYKEGELSIGRAVEIMGVSIEEFIEELKKRNMKICTVDEEEIEKEVDAAGEHRSAILDGAFLFSYVDDVRIAEMIPKLFEEVYLLEDIYKRLRGEGEKATKIKKAVNEGVIRIVKASKRDIRNAARLPGTLSEEERKNVAIVLSRGYLFVTDDVNLRKVREELNLKFRGRGVELNTISMKGILRLARIRGLVSDIEK